MVVHVREVILFVDVWLTVLAILALAKLSAFKSSAIAFTIAFLAH